MAKDDPVRRAVTFAKTGKKSRARQILKEVLEKDMDNVEAWVAMAQLSETKTQAVVCLNQVLRLRPDNRWARMHLGRLTQATPARPTQAASVPTPPASSEPEQESAHGADPVYSAVEGATEIPDWLGEIAPATDTSFYGSDSPDHAMESPLLPEGGDMLSIDPLAGISTDAGDKEGKPTSKSRRRVAILALVVLLALACLALVLVVRAFGSGLPIIGPLLGRSGQGDETTSPGAAPLAPPAEVEPIIIDGVQCPLRATAEYSAASERVFVNLKLAEQTFRAIVASEDVTALPEARDRVDAAEKQFADLTPTPCMQAAHAHGHRAIEAFKQALQTVEGADLTATTAALDAGMDAVYTAEDEIRRVMMQLHESLNP